MAEKRRQFKNLNKYFPGERVIVRRPSASNMLCIIRSYAIIHRKSKEIYYIVEIKIPIRYKNKLLPVPINTIRKLPGTLESNWQEVKRVCGWCPPISGNQRRLP